MLLKIAGIVPLNSCIKKGESTCSFKWVMKPDTFSLLHVCVIDFGLDPAKATVGLQKCWSN